MRLIDADKLIKDLSDLRKSPWANMPYISADRKFGISEALDMIESIVRCEQPTIDAIPIEFIEKRVKAYGDKAEWIKGTEFVYAYLSERVLNLLIADWAERKEE